ncbi:hypothetical protein GIB67_016831 [Kingdonia uniflora]|uniref:GTD-binding domain-containing protein n=1 Tax=Kingdonia uniflora TaxID=39325 RepID=A0A7J7LQ53_9MAGN|nr:hypothetical protein GIB67_016831 [Kingdonia uniflora]
MILRLQGEKAAVKMEASQYKRMVEEKMKHSEESMVDFEGLMYQQEMEIASLQCQLQAYSYKLLSMGFSDIGIPGNLNFRRKESNYFGVLGGHGVVKRNKSLPSIRFTDPLVEGDVHDSESEELENSFSKHNPNTFDEIQDCESKDFEVGDIYTYGEQVEQLQERVEVLSHDSHSKYTGSDWVSSNLEYLEARGTFSSPSSEAENHSCLMENETSGFPCLKIEDTENSNQSLTVHDVFEVPKIHENGELHGLNKQELKIIFLEDEIKIESSDSISHKTLDHCVEDEFGWIKNLSKQRDGVSIECNSAFLGPQPGIVISQTEVLQLQIYLEKLERERRVVKQEAFNTGDEELMLLREIHNQLNMLQSDMRRSNSKSRPPENDSSLVSLMEVCTMSICFVKISIFSIFI